MPTNYPHVNLGNIPEDVIWHILPFTDTGDLDSIRLISPQWNSVVVEYRRFTDLEPVRTLWWTVRPHPPHPKQRDTSRQLFMGFSKELEQLTNYETRVRTDCSQTKYLEIESCRTDENTSSGPGKCASVIFRGRRHFDHLTIFMPEGIREPNIDTDSEAVRGISAAMDGITIDAIEFFRVPFFEKDRSNIIDMVIAHQTKSIELSTDRADTENLGAFFISLAEAGIRTIKLKALKNEPFLGQHFAFWEQTAIEWSRSSAFEFTISPIIGTIFDLLLVKISRRRTIFE